eukprot:COSAG02_NODE_674_length_18616_cov_5.948750_13_plen_271_part_00
MGSPPRTPAPRRVASPPFSPSLSPIGLEGVQGRGLLDPRPGHLRREDTQGVLSPRVVSERRLDDHSSSPSVGRSHKRQLSSLQLMSEITYELHTEHKSVAARAAARKYRNRSSASRSNNSTEVHTRSAASLIVPPGSAGFTAWFGEQDDTAAVGTQWWKHPRSWSTELRSSSAAGIWAPKSRSRPESAGYSGYQRRRPLSASYTGASLARPQTAARVTGSSAGATRSGPSKGNGQLPPELSSSGKAGLFWSNLIPGAENVGWPCREYGGR